MKITFPRTLMSLVIVPLKFKKNERIKKCYSIPHAVLFGATTAFLASNTPTSPSDKKEKKRKGKRMIFG